MSACGGGTCSRTLKHLQPRQQRLQPHYVVAAATLGGRTFAAWGAARVIGCVAAQYVAARRGLAATRGLRTVSLPHGCHNSCAGGAMPRPPGPASGGFAPPPGAGMPGVGMPGAGMPGVGMPGPGMAGPGMAGPGMAPPGPGMGMLPPGPGMAGPGVGHPPGPPGPPGMGHPPGPPGVDGGFGMQVRGRSRSKGSRASP